MSSSDLLNILRFVEDRGSNLQERLEAISKIPQLDPNILVHNIKHILATLTSLGKYVEMGISEEHETYGALLIALSKVLKFTPEHVEKTLEFIKKIQTTFPRVLSGRALQMTLHALKEFISAKPEIIFDPDVKGLFKRALTSTEYSLRLHGLHSLIHSLWIVPWATNYYIDLLNSIISSERDPLRPILFEELGKIAEKSYLPVKPIAQMILEKYKSPADIPKYIVRFIASLNIPIYKREDLNTMGSLLEKISISHRDNEIRVISILGLANMYRNPTLTDEKRRLIKLLEQLSTELVEDPTNVELALACLRALSIPVWGSLEVPEDIVRNLLLAYDRAQGQQRYLFIDAIFNVYSNLPYLLKPVLKFLINELARTTDFEFVRKLTDTLNAIASSAPERFIIEEIMKTTLMAYSLPEEEFGAFIRIWIAENILMHIAKTTPSIILDFADEIIDAYEKLPSVTLYEAFSRIFLQSLRISPEHKKATKLLDYILSAPNYEDTFDIVLRILLELVYKFKEYLANRLDTFDKVLDAMLKRQSEITDVRERYYVVVDAIKNLVRILNAISPAIKPENTTTYCDILLKMLANAPEDAVKDIEFLIKNFIVEPNRKTLMSARAKKELFPPDRLRVLKELGVL